MYVHTDMGTQFAKTATPLVCDGQLKQISKETAEMIGKCLE
jgi:hypothetical protein